MATLMLLNVPPHVTLKTCREQVYKDECWTVGGYMNPHFWFHFAASSARASADLVVLK